jgi:hypothetical protein
MRSPPRCTTDPSPRVLAGDHAVNRSILNGRIRRPSVNDLRERAPGNMNAAAVPPGRGLPPLTGMSEARQDRALARWQILRPHLEDGLALIRLIPARFLLAPQRQDQLSHLA